MKIAILPGDGIGAEIVREAVKVLEALRREGLPIETETAPIGGAGHDAAGQPLPAATLKLAEQADAILGFSLSTLCLRSTGCVEATTCSSSISSTRTGSGL